MTKMELDTQKLTLNGVKFTQTDCLVLLTKLQNRDNDEDLERIIDYWIMLKESGHNGFYLKDYHKITQDVCEAIRK